VTWKYVVCVPTKVGEDVGETEGLPLGEEDGETDG
jgi:hypothetical protein